VAALSLALGAALAPPVGAAQGPRSAPPVSLCSVAGRVTGLTVTRSRPLNAELFTFPRRVTSSDTMAVRALARDLCALPVMPKGVFYCPADWGVTYRLVFTLGADVTTGTTTAVRPVTVDTTGCTRVTGLGAARRTLGSASFFRAFGAAIGLAHATVVTFRGILPPG
jgi:hypothetical protein